MNLCPKNITNKPLNKATDKRIFTTFRYSKTSYCQNCKCFCVYGGNIASCKPPLCQTGNEHEIVLFGCTSRTAVWKVKPPQTRSSYNLEEAYWTYNTDYFFSLYKMKALYLILHFETRVRNTCYYSQGSKKYINKKATCILLKMSDKNK